MPLELSYPPWVTTDMTFILSLTSICSYLYLFDISGNQPPAPFYGNSKRKKIKKRKKVKIFAKRVKSPVSICTYILFKKIILLLIIYDFS